MKNIDEIIQMIFDANIIPKGIGDKDSKEITRSKIREILTTEEYEIFCRDKREYIDRTMWKRSSNLEVVNKTSTKTTYKYNPNNT